MSIRQDTLSTLLFQFLMMGTGVVTNIIVARTLGPEGKGLLSFLKYALFVATSFGGLGLQAAAIQHLGKKRFRADEIAGTQILLSLGTGLVCAAGMAILLPLYNQRMDLPSEILFPFLPVIVLAMLLLNLSGVMIGLGRIRDANYVRFVTPLAWMIGAIVVLAILRGDKTAGAWIWIITQAAAPIAALIWIFSVVRPSLRSFRSCARESLRFGFEAYLANLIWTLLLRIDGMLLAYLGGSRQVGIYSVSVLMAEMAWYLSRSLAMAMSPRIAGGTREDAIRLTHRAARTAFWGVMVAAAGLMLVSRPIILLAFGEAFLPSVRPLLFLLPGIVLGALASPLSLYFTQQRGRPRINAAISGVSLLINLGLNIVLIPRYGAEGAAVASSVAYGLVAGLLLWRFSREPGFSLRQLLHPRREDLQLLRDTVREVLMSLPGRKER